jgi:hypothetical protein
MTGKKTGKHARGIPVSPGGGSIEQQQATERLLPVRSHQQW